MDGAEGRGVVHIHRRLLFPFSGIILWTSDPPLLLITFTYKAHCMFPFSGIIIIPGDIARPPLLLLLLGDVAPITLPTSGASCSRFRVSLFGFREPRRVKHETRTMTPKVSGFSLRGSKVKPESFGFLLFSGFTFQG